MPPKSGTSLQQSQRLQLHQGIHTALHLLSMDAPALTAYLQGEAQRNPYLQFTPPQPRPHGQWSPRWQSAFTRSSVLTGSASPLPDDLEAQGPGLFAHASAEIARILKDPTLLALGGCFVEALEPTGWIGRSLSEIARSQNLPLEGVEAVLSHVQMHCEPSGLFARNLSECLQLQARDAGVLDVSMKIILLNLPLLAAGQITQLAALAYCSEEEALKRIGHIRSFDPKPGARFRSLAAVVREPDLLVRRDRSGQWQVSLNHSAQPSIAVRQLSPAEAPNDPSLRQNARTLERLLQARNSTLLNVARAVIDHQHAVLREGPQALRPLTMAQIGQQLSLHESTISRTVAGVSLDTPSGVISLKKLFAQALGADAASGQGGITSEQIRARLQELIRSEPPHAPLSDQAIAEALNALGMPLARRTVAKYREMLNIPTTRLRKVTENARRPYEALSR